MSQQMRVLITDYAWPTLDIERKAITATGAEVIAASTGEQNELIELAPGVDGILSNWRPLRAPVIAVAEKCQIICRYGVGLDNIDVEAATEHGIVVTNVPDYCMDEVSNEAMALLALRRQRHLGLRSLGSIGRLGRESRHATLQAQGSHLGHHWVRPHRQEPWRPRRRVLAFM